MPTVLSSKGKDINTWRAASDFGASFRQALLNKSASLSSKAAEEMFQNAGQELDRLARENDTGLAGMQLLMEHAAATIEPAQLGEIIRRFYHACYSMFARHRSAVAFYRLSQQFLDVVTASLLTIAKIRLGIPADKLRFMSLSAMGSAGRHEYSPFSAIKMLMVTDITEESETRLSQMIGDTLHKLFEEIGLLIDNVITPRNPEWCMNLTPWQRKLAAKPKRSDEEKLFDLLQLADQTTLVSGNAKAGEFRSLCLPLLRKNRELVSFIVSIIRSLSNGVGMMGRLRLVKSGPYQGNFALLDNALLPFTASVTTLSLIMGGNEVGTLARIRELLARQTISLEQGELLLIAWHTLNEIRLSREMELFPNWKGDASLYIDPQTIPDADMEGLRDALEIIAILKRHVTITFNSWEDQTSC